MTGSGSAGRHLALVLTTAGLVVLPACGGSSAPDVSGQSPAPASPSASTTPEASEAERQGVCYLLEARKRIWLSDFAKALQAQPQRGAPFRAGVAQAYATFAQDLERRSVMTTDAQLGAAVGRWADANREIAEYVRTTEPSGDTVLDFGPGQGRDESANAEVETLCGRRFG